MKLAIIGSGPLAIFCAQHFHHLGAEVVLFQKNALGGSLHFMLKHFPQMELNFKQNKKSLSEFLLQDLKETIHYLEENNLTKAGDVLRVHKRFLNPEEQIEGKSRLHDLFRVVYSVNPKQSILKQVEENPEIFKQLGEAVIESLHLPVESYEDFDLVIEARGLGQSPLPMGPSYSSAINENNLKNSAEIHYGKACLDLMSWKDKKHLILIGNHDLAAAALLKSEEWLFMNSQHSLSWVTSLPIEKKLTNAWLKKEVQRILARSLKVFENEKEVFEKNLHEWRELEDYIRAKVPRPVEPTAKIRLFEGYDVTSVDKLLDQEQIFITIESPDFRSFAPKKNDIRTLAADAVLVANGFYDNEIKKGMHPHEPGYYLLNSDDLESGLMQIREIESKIMAFFTRKK